MRVKTSIALTDGPMPAYLAHLERQARDRRDVEIIDRNADRLNREALDTLEYQQLSRNAASKKTVKRRR